MGFKHTTETLMGLSKKQLVQICYEALKQKRHAQRKYTRLIAELDYMTQEMKEVIVKNELY